MKKVKSAKLLNIVKFLLIVKTCLLLISHESFTKINLFHEKLNKVTKYTSNPELGEIKFDPRRELNPRPISQKFAKLFPLFLEKYLKITLRHALKPRLFDHLKY